MVSYRALGLGEFGHSTSLLFISCRNEYMTIDSGVNLRVDRFRVEFTA